AVTSTRCAGTPGSATRTTISCSSSKTSTGGSHVARVRPVAARRKNCRCIRSASSITSQACAHIQSVGKRDDIGAPVLSVGPDPLEESGQVHRARLPCNLAAVAESDQRRNAADAIARRKRLLAFGVDFRNPRLGGELPRRTI